MTKPRQHIKKQRHYFAYEAYKDTAFPIVMYGDVRAGQ